MRNNTVETIYRTALTGCLIILLFAGITACNTISASTTTTTLSAKKLTAAEIQQLKKDATTILDTPDLTFNIKSNIMYNGEVQDIPNIILSNN